MIVHKKVLGPGSSAQVLRKKGKRVWSSGPLCLEAPLRVATLRTIWLEAERWMDPYFKTLPHERPAQSKLRMRHNDVVGTSSTLLSGA